jgi:hypothetical protein
MYNKICDSCRKNKSINKFARLGFRVTGHAILRNICNPCINILYTTPSNRRKAQKRRDDIACGKIKVVRKKHKPYNCKFTRLGERIHKEIAKEYFIDKLTYVEIARKYDISPPSIRAWILKGKITHYMCDSEASE